MTVSGYGSNVIKFVRKNKCDGSRKTQYFVYGTNLGAGMRGDQSWPRSLRVESKVRILCEYKRSRLSEIRISVVANAL